MNAAVTRISVVVPCYNAEAYLAQTLGSALDQDRPPDEVIVVDDGSTDGSLDIARRFEATVPHVVRVYQERSGSASRTRNIGADIATGGAILFLDADDVLRPDTVGGLAEALARQPSGMAICPWFRLVYAESGWEARPPSCRPRRQGEDPLSAWLGGWYHPPCSVLWSRQAFDSAGRWDEQITNNDDGDLVMRALARGVSLVEASEGAGFYRRRADGELSLSDRRFTRRSLQDRLRVVRKVAFVLRESGRLDGYRPALATAFGLVASDAEAAHPDLARSATALARYHRPPARRRLVARLRPPAGPAVPAPREPSSGRDVPFGLKRAWDVIENRTIEDVALERPGWHRPRVSVIVPTFNRAAVLPRAIHSVLAQSWTDFELLIVDDGSTDATADVVARHRDPRMRYLRQPRNAGVSAARNRGLRDARGDFVAFLDSDDEWLPGKLLAQLTVFERAPADLGLVYTGVECVCADGRRRVDVPEERGDVYRHMLGRNVVHGGGSNVMMRRNVVAVVGFFDERLRAIEDYEYWLRIARFFTVDYVAEPLIRYHDPVTADRRSQALAANLETREWFFRKYAREMRHAGVAHLFLLKSMRRALAAERPDVGAARRLAIRAVREAPTSRMVYQGLLRALRVRAPQPERGT
jgi:O-antigen biosynthesis protein